MKLQDRIRAILKPKSILMILASVVASSAAVFCQSLIDSYTWASSFVFLYPSIFFIALFMGSLPATVSWLICLAGANYLYVFPHETFIVANPHEAISLAIFAVLGGLLIIATHYHRNIREALQEKSFEVADIGASQKRISSLLAEMSEMDLLGIFCFRFDGAITEANGAFLRMLGYTEKDLEEGEINWEKLTPKKWAERDEDASAEFRKSGRVEAFEKEFITKDGEVVPVLVSAAQIESANEEGASFVFDLRKQKKIEQLQKELHLLIENSQEMVILTDRKGMIEYANDKVKKLLRVEKDSELREINFCDRVVPEEACAEQLIDLEGFDGFAYIQDPERENIPVQLQSFPVLENEGDTPERFAFLGRDLSGEIESKERLETALDIAQMAIWQYDLKTQEFSRSEEHDRLYGFETNVPEWTEELFYSLIHPADRQTVKNQFESFLETDEASFAMTYRIHLANGEIRWLNSRGRVVKENGSRRKLLGGVLDVTELKNIELELKKALRTRDRFLSIASHELKTPLSAINLQLEILNEILTALESGQDVDAEDITEVMKQTSSQLARLTDLVDDLLDVTKISQGKLPLKKQPTDLVQMWESVVQSLRYPPGIELSVEDNLQKAAVDESRMQQVMLNLVNNAIKFGKNRPIEINVNSRKGHSIFSVKDYGVGIPKAKIPRVFDRFGQAHADPGARGLGLGLYISREIVKAHGGEIRIESREGQGTKVAVELPEACGS